MIQVLKENKESIRYVVSYLKGISLSYCMHKIIIEDNFKRIAQPQCISCHKRSEEATRGMNCLPYFIHDLGESVSPINVVSKKGGMIVIQNKNDELIPTRIPIYYLL